MANLETRTTKVNIIIRKNCALPISKIKDFCDTYFALYAFIEHKNDKKVETGEIEGTHYHIVGNLKEKARLSTTLNRIQTYFRFENPFGLQIQKYATLEGSIQYLIHKYDKDKTPHEVSEIVSNIEKEELKTLLDSENTALSVDRLWFIVESNCRFDSRAAIIRINRKEIIRALGLNNFCSKHLAVEWAIMDIEEKLRDKY